MRYEKTNQQINKSTLEKKVYLCKIVLKKDKVVVILVKNSKKL